MLVTALSMWSLLGMSDIQQNSIRVDLNNLKIDHLYPFCRLNKFVFFLSIKQTRVCHHSYRIRFCKICRILHDKLLMFNLLKVSQFINIFSISFGCYKINVIKINIKIIMFINEISRFMTSVKHIYFGN